MSKVSQFCIKPLREHWQAIKGIFRYLRGTESYGITLGDVNSEDTQLFGSCDASFAGDIDCRFSPKTKLYIGGRKSHTGYIFWYGGSPVSWKSFRQGRVALSSTEAEIIALVSATQELIWLRELVDWIAPGSITKPTPIEQDNQSAIYLVTKNTLNKRSKHYGKDYFFVTEHVESGILELRKQKTDFITSDLLTKPLMRQAFLKHVVKLLGPEERGTIDIAREIHKGLAVTWGASSAM